MSVVWLWSPVQLATPLMSSAPVVFTATSETNHCSLPTVPVAAMAAVGAVLSSFTTSADASVVRPASFVQAPARSVRAVSCVCDTAALVHVTGELIESLPVVAAWMSDVNQPLLPSCGELVMPATAVGPLLSSFTVSAAACVVRPAPLVQEPLNTWPAVSAVCDWSAVHVTPPLSASLPDVETVTSPTNHPFAPWRPLAARSADGPVLSILMVFGSAFVR